MVHQCHHGSFLPKGWTIGKLMGGVGGGGRRRSTKKIFAHGKIRRKKNSCTLINPKKYSCHGLKKISYKEFDNEKKIPHPRPPITFLMVRP